jgi:hypothetical protein
MVDKIIPDDLRNVQSDKKTNDYFLIPLNDLNPGEMYNMQFAWVYPDKTNSEWSSTFSVVASSEMVNLTQPRFLSTDLEGGNGFIKISYSGYDINNNLLKGIKQVNIWIKGGNYGNTYTNLATIFTAPGTKTISLPLGTYTFKLQAESHLGNKSAFSDERSAKSIKSPGAVSNITGTWVKDDGTTKTDTLKVGFTFDSTLNNADNSNLLSDRFIIYLTSGNKTSPGIPWSINKSSSAQSFYLSASDNKAIFGLFAKSFTISIIVVDTFGTESILVSQSSLEYQTPLDNPVIIVTPGILSYTVSYNSQSNKPFDQIYIEEIESESNSAPTTGWGQISQGTQNPLTVQTLNANKRWVRAKFYDTAGGSTSYSTAVAVTPSAAVTADTDGPGNVGSVTVVGSLDLDGVIGFNGHATISWTSVTGNGIRGYRIRWRQVATPSPSYSYVDSPGTNLSYHLSGLGVGLSYEFAVATYDEYNNTSTQYIAGNNITIDGTPYIAGTVNVEGYFSAKANESDLDSTAFKFGYGVDTGKRGLSFNSNNYWYIDSNQSASLKVGGSNNNITWNGDSLAVTGNIQAKKGTFSGNINMVAGASIYSGTIGGNITNAAGDTGGSLTSAGYILNSDGITFSNGLLSTAKRETNIVAATGLFTTNTANIGNWLVDTTTISKNGITLTAPVSSSSKPSIIINKGAYYLGLQTPNPSSPSGEDIVLWAGQDASGTAANFRVNADGKLFANGAKITGDVVVTVGETYNFLQETKTTADGKNTIYYQAGKPTLGPFKTGDMWVDTDDNNKIYVYGISDFVLAQDSASAKATADLALPATSFNVGSIVSKINGDINKDTSTLLPAGIYAQAIVGGALISSNANTLNPSAIGEFLTTAGTAINLNNGTFSSKGFRIDSSGNAYFLGSIESGSTIKGATFETTNYSVSAKHGLKILTVGNGEVISFSYSGSEIATIKSFLSSTSPGESADGGPAVSLRIDSPGKGSLGFYSTGTSLYSNGYASFEGTSMGIRTNTGGLSITGKTSVIINVDGVSRVSMLTNVTNVTGPVSASLMGGTNRLYLDNDSATLTSSNQSSGYGLRNIKFTTTATTPVDGATGDIVLVYV